MPADKKSFNKQRGKSFVLIALMLLMISTLLISCDEFIDSDYRFEETFSKTIALKEAGSFSLENVNGSVTITTLPSREVVIKATKHARREKSDLDKIKIEVIQGERAVKVNTIYEKKNLRVKVDYDITVPEGLSLELVRTVNGKIVISGKYDRAQLKTTNGSVEARGDFSWLDISTTNGSIAVIGVKGKVDLRTTNGSIKAELHELSADFRARTTNGSIRLALGHEADARLVARTTNGSIKVEYPVTVEGTVSRRRLEGKLGQGGEITVSLETTNGSISLLKL
ncbi:MAG TPA: DUF4097 family beta strand repeat-containing protein [Candidatus Saccharicenans sp.]|jgi:DUF4097 and DUF4098 domain-containing protein YvlB|nr:DUF4097 family beta strand repeat-containing protein [Candidatus Saccharicenans sp.]HOL45587.1 DUF4097 family beta strand repeat-containing protein [Candidatus Saccharicenans sp.]HOM93994.1 DUF4097 family beta strand repeat-containing protein [Candidatus Saccharicenans sp.]HOT68052.1 DUF4097 family beta strand repeat-containing protein [Candidatus Saccharicenans sp.]HPC88015.1 DUF4097 family beta strand repeat-containing protein [Candidatus Saccharicenans sp.]